MRKNLSSGFPGHDKNRAVQQHNDSKRPEISDLVSKGIVQSKISSENKGADQSRNYRTDDLRFCFRRSMQKAFSLRGSYVCEAPIDRIEMFVVVFSILRRISYVFIFHCICEQERHISLNPT